MEEKSNFGPNLICQAVLIGLINGLAVSFKLSLNPLGDVFHALGIIVATSFWIGFVYAFFRMMGLKIDAFEWFYQNVPMGWYRVIKNEADVSEQKDCEDNKNLNTVSYGSDFNWDKLLSVEYLRYAGALLIFSAVFSLLFKIDWLLVYKIYACFGLGIVSLVGAEVLRSRQFKKLSNCLFLISFALVQFGLSLLYSYDQDRFFNDLNNILILKFVVLTIFAGGLLRYSLQFTQVIFFVISFVAPLSLGYSGAVFSTAQILICVISISVINLLFAARTNSILLSIVNIVFSFSYLGSVLASANISHFAYWQLRRNFYENSFEELVTNLYVLVSFIALLIAHLILSGVYSYRKSQLNSKEKFGSTIFYYLFSQIFYGIGVLATVSQISGLQDYMGAAVVILSSFSFIAYLLMRLKNITNSFTEVILNYSLLISAIGMFMETEGPWSAIVFLIFACFAIYIAIVMGTTRTKVYSFFVLTISLFKLYTECIDLFDSLSGTSTILVVGIVLIGLSFKLEKIKKII